MCRVRVCVCACRNTHLLCHGYGEGERESTRVDRTNVLNCSPDSVQSYLYTLHHISSHFLGHVVAGGNYAHTIVKIVEEKLPQGNLLCTTDVYTCIAVAHTSWSELLYMNAFWNINSISLWNSMSVVVSCIIL